MEAFGLFREEDIRALWTMGDGDGNRAVERDETMHYEYFVYSCSTIIALGKVRCEIDCTQSAPPAKTNLVWRPKKSGSFRFQATMMIPPLPCDEKLDEFLKSNSLMTSFRPAAFEKSMR
ncbi:hypothetical protein Trydic_g19213 [Trypoxylus dichotomus]